MRTESGPEVAILPRSTGGLRATPMGPTVLSGQRHGRAVRIEIDGGSLRTVVHQPDAPDRLAVTEPGPGQARLWTSGGHVVLERSLPGGALVGPDSLTILLRDLQRAEQAADSAREVVDGRARDQ